MLLAIHKLLQGADHSQITHKFVKTFKSFKALRNYADRSSDVALLNKIKVGAFHTHTLSQSEPLFPVAIVRM